MATYSINQTRVPIVALAASSSDSTTPGNFKGVVKVGDDLYLQYVNALGELVKSDAIPIKNIISAKATKYVASASRVDKLTFTQLVPGQAYSLTVLFREFGSGSQEDTYTLPIGPVYFVSGQTAEDVVDELVTLGNQVANNKNHKFLAFSKEGATESAKLVITEIPQEWTLGLAQGRQLQYTIYLTPITVDGIETTDWGTITTTPAKPGNGTGHEAADMEYFYHGQIGDTYRFKGWPYVWQTKYLVDPNGIYDYIDLSFYFAGENSYVQHSNKQILIICKKSGASDYTVANAIIGLINAKVSGLLTELA